MSMREAYKCMLWWMSLKWSFWVQEYKAGFERFMADMRARRDMKVCLCPQMPCLVTTFTQLWA